MSKVDSEKFVQEFSKFLGDKLYFTAADLIELGFFGSSSGAKKALENGIFPSIRISPKRVVIPRSAVISYFRENLSLAAR